MRVRAYLQQWRERYAASQRLMWVQSAAFAFAITALAAGAGVAQHHGNSAPHARPYAGQEARGVASLSADEVQGFLAGRGMGLAKAAELNGYPGPSHVLELADELGLTATQRAQVQDAFERMQARAAALGADYINAEKAVDEAFKSPTADAALIAQRVGQANRLLGEVRLSHLAAHLEIAPLLSPEQRARYAELRGYTGANSTNHMHKPR